MQTSEDSGTEDSDAVGAKARNICRKPMVRKGSERPSATSEGCKQQGFSS